MRRYEDDLPDELRDAVELLRVEEPVRPAWRDHVVRRASASRRVSLPVPWAIAAGIACAIAGSAATMVLVHRGQQPAPMHVAQVAPGAPALLPVKFTVVAPTATRVSIVGDFNGWDPAALPMKRSADGRLWEIEVRLPVGRYTYGYMVDGRIQPDPAAPRTTDDGFGAPNSVLMVRGS